MSYREREVALTHRRKAGRNQQREEGEDLNCECGDVRCNATLQLTPVERAARRARPTRFWVKPGHVLITLERIVEENDRYAIVEGDKGVALYVVAQ
jgi:hypothetical protein